ncbi:hypothetical protein THERMOS_839 [Bathymodiolus thermophilus thioautotrophic gill symbiont]|uniref:Uncharacterized protein n=1 Tax=Bathymodiolus thermophilus thioautotrophic gill symbiont TaxID=2360 RepID=A0A8H9CH67_9GAMM|nr:hypothetical protein THERMOS_839 [Bathymodiolus thermophilus thioautotrophic gill symbiont]
MNISYRSVSPLANKKTTPWGGFFSSIAIKNNNSSWATCI